MLVVYQIVPVPEKDGDDKKPKRNRWMPMGVAFQNRDGSINVHLDALPTNGNMLQIRKPFPPEDRGG